MSLSRRGTECHRREEIVRYCTAELAAQPAEPQILMAARAFALTTTGQLDQAAKKSRGHSDRGKSR